MKNFSPCHIGPVEIIPGLFLGSLDDALLMPSRGATTLVALCSLDGSIWEPGFCGEIIYCPIEDYGILSDNTLNQIVDLITSKLSGEVRIGIFCMGGHGRTGYVASVVLGRMGFLDPIGHLRAHYCKHAVESNIQVRHIASILGLPKLMDKYLE